MLFGKYTCNSDTIVAVSLVCVKTTARKEQRKGDTVDKIVQNSIVNFYQTLFFPCSRSLLLLLHWFLSFISLWRSSQSELSEVHSLAKESFSASFTNTGSCFTLSAVLQVHVICDRSFYESIISQEQDYHRCFLKKQNTYNNWTIN